MLLSRLWLSACAETQGGAEGGGITQGRTWRKRGEGGRGQEPLNYAKEDRSCQWPLMSSSSSIFSRVGARVRLGLGFVFYMLREAESFSQILSGGKWESKG